MPSFLFESVSFDLSSEVSGTSVNALSSNSSSTKKNKKKFSSNRRYVHYSRTFLDMDKTKLQQQQ